MPRWVRPAALRYPVPAYSANSPQKTTREALRASRQPQRLVAPSSWRARDWPSVRRFPTPSARLQRATIGHSWIDALEWLVSGNCRNCAECREVVACCRSPLSHAGLMSEGRFVTHGGVGRNPHMRRPPRKNSRKFVSYADRPACAPTEVPGRRSMIGLPIRRGRDRMRRRDLHAMPSIAVGRRSGSRR